MNSTNPVVDPKEIEINISADTRTDDQPTQNFIAQIFIQLMTEHLFEGGVKMKKI